MLTVSATPNPVPIEDRYIAAAQEMVEAHGALALVITKIGMTRSFSGDDPNAQLLVMIERYTAAVAHHQILKVLLGEDFYLAMARSAGAVSSHPS